MWSKTLSHSLLQFCRQGVRHLTDGPPERVIAVFTGERGVNSVNLLGRVGRHPDIRGTQEKTVTVFSLATSQSFKRTDGTFLQKTEWHRISVFRPVLKDIVAATVKKGDRVFVSGAINYGKFTDKNTNQEVYTTNIIADNVINLTKSPSSGGGGGGGGVAVPPLADTQDDDTMDYEDVDPSSQR